LSNELIVADFMFSQKCAYTYFVHKNRTYTWIDHVMTYKHDTQNTISCRIICDDGNSVSDHLPIETICQVQCDLNPASTITKLKTDTTFTSWTTDNSMKYKDLLQVKLNNLPSLDISEESDKQSIKQKIDGHMDSLNSILLNAAREAGCTKQHRAIHKPYWCPNLSQLRDRKRFWYHLWCENGKPRSGVVYQCHKDLKKLYRRRSRWNLDHIEEIRYRKMNHLFKEHNIRGFWNMVKKCRNI